MHRSYVNAAFVFPTKYKKDLRARTRTRGLNYFSRKAEWEASDQWTTRSLIYRRPKQTDRGTCIEFFIRIALVFFPSLGFFLKILARERPAASILLLKDWTAVSHFRERKCSLCSPKMHVATLVSLSILLFRALHHTHGYNILGVCPSASYSHQQPFRALMKALAARGHGITVASTIPLEVYINLYFLSPITPHLSSIYLSVYACVCVYIYTYV